MTQPTKTVPSDFTTKQTNDASFKQELDFSFFDGPSTEPYHQSPVPNSDFAIFDAPTLSTQTTQQNEVSHVDFSFDEETKTPITKDIQPETITEDSNQMIAESLRHPMTFTCLKCSATEQVDLPEYIEHDLTITCHSCSSAILITLESNAKRAAQKSREIYCCKCGHVLDHHPHCPSCGQFCPNYYIVENPAEASRKARAARSNNIKQTIANLKSSLTWSPSSRDTGSSSWKAPRTSSISTKTDSFLPKAKLLRLASYIVVLILVIALPSFYYLKLQTEKRYVTNYIKITYALHVGSETVIAAMNTTVNEWKSARTSGVFYSPRTNSDLEARSARIEAEVTKLMRELEQKTPGKYEQANKKLASFHTEFIQLQKTASTLPTSYEQLSAQIAATEKSLQQKKQEIKASMDEDLQNELTIAKSKFRGFNDF